MYGGKQPTAERRADIKTTDDVSVARFRAAGALIVGMTTMTEGGVTPLGYAAFFKGPYNPYNTSFYSGGSSGGSAVAVASGLTPVSIGFDGGGSIRIPAALSGCVGYGGTFARMPFEGSMTGGTMVKTGVLAASVRDAALAYAVMAPSEPGHFYSTEYGRGGPPAPHLKGFEHTKRLDGEKFGVFQFHQQDSDPEVLAAFDAAVAQLEALGAEVVDIEIPHMHWLGLSHGMTISVDFALAFDDLHASVLEANTQLTLKLGSSMTALDVLAAQKLRRFAFNHIRDLFQQGGLTAILTPTVAHTAPEIPPGALETGEYNVAAVVRMMKHIFLGNLVGLPGVSVPIAYDEDKMPIALQLVGWQWQDSELLRVARVLEDSWGWEQRRRPEHFVDLLLQ